MDTLLELLRREREAVVKRDIDRLLECVRHKEVLNTQWRILEESRRALMERIREEVGRDDGEDLDLERIFSRGRPSQIGRWRELREDLAAKAREARRIQEGNRYLIQAALGHVSKTLSLLSQFRHGPSVTYDQNGVLKSGDNPNGINLLSSV
jgi:hypothetical protein